MRSTQQYRTLMVTSQVLQELSQKYTKVHQEQQTQKQNQVSLTSGSRRSRSSLTGSMLKVLTTQQQIQQQQLQQLLLLNQLTTIAYKVEQIQPTRVQLQQEQSSVDTTYTSHQKMLTFHCCYKVKELAEQMVMHQLTT